MPGEYCRGNCPGAIFFFEAVLTKTFLFNNFFIFKISNPPYLSIVGLSKRLTIVDSKPILHFPPSKIYLIFDPNSSITSEALTELNLVDIFALGAANG